MQKLNFSITLNLSLTLEQGKASINLENVDLKPPVDSVSAGLDAQDSISASKSHKKKTTHDIILHTAKKHVVDTGQNKFTGAKLYHLACLKHPRLKRNTFAARIIAAEQFSLVGPSYVLKNN